MMCDRVEYQRVLNENRGYKLLVKALEGKIKNLEEKKKDPIIFDGY